MYFPQIYAPRFYRKEKGAAKLIKNCAKTGGTNVGWIPNQSIYEKNQLFSRTAAGFFSLIIRATYKTTERGSVWIDCRWRGVITFLIILIHLSVIRQLRYHHPTIVGGHVCL